jgi:large subunit ribosomal protein L33
MASKSKSNIKIILRSSDPASSYFYTAKKSKKNKEKLRLRKFDPIVNKHVEFVEEKMR